MRREGRQHGYVRNHLTTKMKMMVEDGVKERDCCSKGKGKGKWKCRGRGGCRYCELEPASKSRGKTKGLRKHTSTDLLSSYRVYAWRVVMDHNNPNRLSSNIGQSSSDFISSLAQGDDEYLEDDDDISHTLTEEAGEEVIESPHVQEEEEEKLEEVEVTEFSSCDSESWTTENLCETDLEEWCLVDENIQCI
ncbi:hypothetical protein SUGI_0739910 [Cryptomeria japonica]|uniref:uncharacterized protein LOC131030412 n=1 Tax=Cryptomeria japonica TaxID=3369 RepID=UPI0024146CD7|nr:uncharacterized protein LOC131030412 [Cryptomeria japonica]GLJ36744.1 hypothetical protein SUGI_0739910 [Cryptomeria japonica]